MCLSGHDTSLPGSFTDALCCDPQVLALRDRVAVTADDSLTEMQARVIVICRDGTRQRLFHDLDEENPLSERQNRVRAKAAALLGRGRSDALWELICDQATPDALAAALAS